MNMNVQTGAVVFVAYDVAMEVASMKRSSARPKRTATVYGTGPWALLQRPVGSSPRSAC